MAKKVKQSNSRAAVSARARRAAAKQKGDTSLDPNAGTAGNAPGFEAATIPASAKPTKTDAENAAEQSANAASEIARRRHEPGAPDPEGDGPDVGRVDNRPETSFETQQMPRPARPLTPVNATAERMAAPVTPEDEDPLFVDRKSGFPKKVRAISLGYLRHSRRRAGDVFLIYNAKEFSPKWMEYAGASDPEKITTGQQELEQQRRRSLEDQLAKKRAGSGDANVLGA